MQNTLFTRSSGDLVLEPISAHNTVPLSRWNCVMVETSEQRRILELEAKVAALEEKVDNLWLATTVSDLL